MSKKHIPVEGHHNLVRDANTGAIININKKSIDDARLAKERRFNEKQRHLDLETDVKTLKEDMSFIKELLQKMVNRHE